MAKHIDLLVADGDFVIDGAGFGAAINDRASIAQDIKHRIIEGGYLVRLIGERDPRQQEAIKNAMIIDIEKDKRLVAGTARAVTDTNNGNLIITAVTIEYSDLRVDFEG